MAGGHSLQSCPQAACFSCQGSHHSWLCRICYQAARGTLQHSCTCRSPLCWCTSGCRSRRQCIHQSLEKKAKTPKVWTSKRLSLAASRGNESSPFSPGQSCRGGYNPQTKGSVTMASRGIPVQRHLATPVGRPQLSAPASTARQQEDNPCLTAEPFQGLIIHCPSPPLCKICT